MNKQSLLESIANKGYNIGFGAKKHFITYHIYSQLPKTLSAAIIFVGIFQLLDFYDSISHSTQQLISALLICIGIVALVLDSGSKDKSEYNRVGKILTGFYNELHVMYNTVKSLNNSESIICYSQRLDEIEKEFQIISISDQLPFTHLYTNLSFFFAGPQIDWLDEQLHFSIRDKFPFLHYEAITIYLILISCIYFAIKSLVK